MSFAIFDLDQTLLPYDTQGLFCNHVLKKHPLRRAYLFLFVPAVLLRALRLLSTKTLKRLFLSYLRGLRPAEIDALLRSFVEQDVLPALYPDLLAEIARHRADGRTLILNSASPTFCVAAIAARLGFHHAIGTAVQLRDPMPLCPPIPGPNNKYEAKLQAMRHLLPPNLALPLPDSWAYSASRADLPLLRFVEHPVAVHPDPRLATVATREHWPVLLPPRPQTSRAAFQRDCFLQALGLFSSPRRP